jgi:lysine 2,3-aminomutase
VTIFNRRQQKIAGRIEHNVELSNWKDWRWQAKHAVTSADALMRLLGIELSMVEQRAFEQTAARFPMRATPYYLSLIDAEDYRNCPIYRQSVPAMEELSICSHDMLDPLAEDADSPVPGLTHRYPDRVLFHVSNVCAMYCRHCTRKRKVGDADSVPTKAELTAGIEYVRATPAIRDVLLSGGDPLMLSTARLDWLLTELQAIPHVEIIRIGTRTPVVLPYRIDDELVAMLKRHQPLWLNFHFNHPRELTTSSKTALRKLADAGFPLGNQTVLLAGVNDCPRIMKSLVHKLVQNRVRPYYLYQCDLAEGLDHFRTPVGKGVEILESLIGHTSGFAVPTYVIDAPGGGGKIPVMPNYLISWSTNKVVLRNYEGVITTYKEPDSYQPTFCDRLCSQCKLHLKLEEADEYKAVGIEKLLSAAADTESLTPMDNERLARRNEDHEDH